jgi:tetratricopeptide (TPR) repeat protein
VTDTTPEGPVASDTAAAPPRRSWLNLVLAVTALLLLGGILVGAFFVVQAAKPQAPQTMEEAQIQQLQAQLKKSPRNSGLYLSLAASYYKVKAYDKALEALGSLQSINPTGTVLAESVYAQAKIAEVRGDRNAAMTGYAKSLAVTETAEATWALGLLQLSGKQYPQAVRSLTRYSVIMPNDADVYVRLGAAYEGSGDRVKALASYEKAKSFVPDNAVALAAITRLKGHK